jgi:drug/metabolite transporter (DMT)-like permease
MLQANASTQHASLKSFAAKMAFVLLWSGGFSVAKIAVEYAPPLTLLALRYGCSICLLIPLFIIMKPALPKSRADWVHACVVGFLVQVVYFGLSYLAFKAGASAGVVAVIVSLQPVLVAALAPRLVGERVGARQWLGLALGLIGATGVIVARSSLSVHSMSGLLLAIGALVGMTAALLYEKRFGVGQHPVTANLIQYAIGLVFCAPLALLLEDVHVHWTGAFIAALGYLVIGNSLIAITLLLALVRAGQASKIASLFFFIPPVAAALSSLLLKEVMPPLAWGAMVFAVAGVALATWSTSGVKPKKA